MVLGVQSQKTSVEMVFHETAASGFQLCLYREGLEMVSRLGNVWSSSGGTDGGLAKGVRLLQSGTAGMSTLSNA